MRLRCCWSIGFPFLLLVALILFPPSQQGRAQRTFLSGGEDEEVNFHGYYALSWEFPGDAMEDTNTIRSKGPTKQKARNPIGIEGRNGLLWWL